jgi:hypothetical protein
VQLESKPSKIERRYSAHVSPYSLGLWVSILLTRGDPRHMTVANLVVYLSGRTPIGRGTFICSTVRIIPSRPPCTFGGDAK